MSTQVLTVMAYLALIILVINVFLASLMVFFERRNPASTWAWLLVLFFIPIFGFLIYLIFGKNGKQEKMFREKEEYDQKVYFKYLFHDRHSIEKIQRQKALIESRGRLVEADYLTDLAYLHLNSGNWMTFNNKVTAFSRGKDKFEALVRDIRKAKKFIHLEYYIWRGDKLGGRLLEELIKKAKEGVEVRLLYDGMGNSSLPKKYFEKLHQAGGFTAAFLPPFIVRLNYRNHRKLCIIDGQVGYIGGFNVGDEYLGIVKRYGPWRDTHLRFEGDAVDQMQIRFIMDWNFTAKNGAVVLEDKYFPERDQWDGVETQIVSSGPCYQYEKGFIHAKTLCIDGLVASVGTANMDVRSFDLNFEVNAFMFDAALTKSLEADFLRDLESSVEITKDWYYRRKWWFKVKEAVARLISPML